MRSVDLLDSETYIDKDELRALRARAEAAERALAEARALLESARLSIHDVPGLSKAINAFLAAHPAPAAGQKE